MRQSFYPPIDIKQVGLYRPSFIIRQKLGNRRLHTSGFAAETPSGESSLVLCSFGLAGPAHFLLALAGEEGVFKRHLGAVSRRLDTPDSICPQNPAPESSPLDSAAMAPCPRPSMKLTDSSCQSKQIDYFILVTNPGSDCRGAYFNYKSHFNI